MANGVGERYAHAITGIGAHRYIAAECTQFGCDALAFRPDHRDHRGQRSKHGPGTGRDHGFTAGQELQQFVALAGGIETASPAGRKKNADKGHVLRYAVFRSNGSLRKRLPVRRNTAFANAGASGGRPGSPIPVGGSDDGTMCTSTCGISLMRATV